MPPPCEQISESGSSSPKIERGFDRPSFKSLAEAFCSALYRKTKFSDLLLITYIAALVRQYLWGIGNQPTAWGLTALLACALWCAHVQAREVERGLSWSFWLMVGLPLLLIYAVRAPFPDFSYDVMNYHLVHAERGLRGWPFISGDFFPTVMQVNPAPDMVSGIFRHALGYRLGTIVNLFALLWVGAVVDRFLRHYIKGQWLRGAGVLLVVSTEYMLHLLYIYQVDLLALPLLLEATYLVLYFSEVKRKDYSLVHIALFLGISVAFKLTNLAIVIPLTIILLYQTLTGTFRFNRKYIALAALAFILPLVPFSLYMYWQTGNPVFPFYNKIFASPYWLARNFKDPIYGPQSLFETFIWPIWAVFYPERISEMSGLSAAYTGRISLGFVIAALCVACKSLGKEMRILCFISLVGSLLWSMASGNVRYGLYLEIMGGMIIFALVSTIYYTQRAAAAACTLRTSVCIVLTVGLVAMQVVASYHHVFRYDQFTYGHISQPTVFRKPGRYITESEDYLLDYGAEKYLAPGDRQRIDRVDVWINSFYTTSGIELMLKRDAPMLSVCDYFSMFDYFETETSRRRFNEALAVSRGKRMFSLTYAKHLQESLDFITARGLTIGEMTPLEVPYFSRRNPLHMVLIEVLPQGEGVSKDEAMISAARLCFPKDEEN